MRLDAVVAHAIKLSANISGVIRRDAIDRFINNTETHFGAGNWRAVRIARQDRVRRCFARLVFFLV